MENYYYFLSTLSSQFPIRRKLKYFSTSEKRYRLFGKNVAYVGEIDDAWTNRASGGIVGSASDVIRVVTNTCGDRKVIFAASVHECALQWQGYPLSNA